MIIKNRYFRTFTFLYIFFSLIDKDCKFLKKLKIALSGSLLSCFLFKTQSY